MTNTTNVDYLGQRGLIPDRDGLTVEEEEAINAMSAQEVEQLAAIIDNLGHERARLIFPGAIL
jgi:hypothetical protein